MVLFHASCPDGFGKRSLSTSLLWSTIELRCLGAAFAAWLRVGDKATYIPCEHDRKRK